MKTRSEPVYVEDYKCPICLSIPSDPVATPCCDQLFCRGCLDDALDDKKKCPMDRQPLTSDQVRDIDKSRIEWKRWSEMTVACQGHELGCIWSGIAKDYERHAEICHLLKMSNMVSGANRINRTYESYLKLSRKNIGKIESIHGDCDALLQNMIRLRQVSETYDENETTAIVNETHETLRKLRDLLGTATRQSRKLIQSVARCLALYQEAPVDTLKMINNLVETAQYWESMWADTLKSCYRYHMIILETKASIEKILVRLKVMIDEKITPESDQLDELLMDVERVRSRTIEVQSAAINYYERMLES